MGCKFCRSTGTHKRDCPRRVVTSVTEDVCRHCKQRYVSRSRGLCWSCYYRPGVRENYPTKASKYNQRGIRDSNGRRPLSAESTQAPPGSAEKVAILEARAGRREALWHPDDARRS